MLSLLMAPTESKNDDDQRAQTGKIECGCGLFIR